jgi:hypothetical protein
VISPSTASRDERGQVVVFFALLLPVLFGLAAIVIAIGNWYTHAKHLQTKADASVFAGGTAWAFPCEDAIDARIEAQARTYVGPHMKADGTSFVGTTFNPQVGGVTGSQIHAVLNGSDWYDDDSNPLPTERNDPQNPSICSANILDVKATEDNSFPLASVLPFFPDIKRKARLEIQEIEALQGVLPVAVRAPYPVSAAAVFYNEANGDILRVKYLVKRAGIFGLPSGLQGWSTENSEDPTTWASFSPALTTGVAIAISFRGACDTNLPNPNTKIATQPAPCFEDAGFGTVNQLCNQGSGAQIVDCFWATGTWPSASVQSGLHFIHGYADANPGTGPPAIEPAYLENVSCDGNAYFSRHPSTGCQAKLHVTVDAGTLRGEYPNPSPPPADIMEDLKASDVQVRYRLVRSNGTSFCNFGTQCDLIGSGSGSNMSFSTQGSPSSPHLPITVGSRGNAVAIEIQVRNAQNHPNPFCQNDNFNNNCRWFYTGNGMLGTSVAPTDAQILAAPIQRAFRGNTVASGSIQWLRLTQDSNCDGVPPFAQDLQAASAQIGGNRCFLMEMGLKGGLAQDADEPPILFNDGVGASQMGAVDCDPNIQQGQILIDGVINGCGPWYTAHEFDTNPLCPLASNIFLTPNPGPPWDDWPPLQCIKTRPTGQMTQLRQGFNGRFFGDQNATQCPPDDATQPVRGRNYWDRDTNAYHGASFRDDDPAPTPNNLHDDDPRLVTIFLTTSEGFTGSGQNTYPISGFISIYVTGYGAILGSSSIRVDDPCPGSAPPTDLDLSGGVTGGYTIWGHILKQVLAAPGTTSSGKICDPIGSETPCVPVLVE